MLVPRIPNFRTCNPGTTQASCAVPVLAARVIEMEDRDCGRMRYVVPREGTVNGTVSDELRLRIREHFPNNIIAVMAKSRGFPYLSEYDEFYRVLEGFLSYYGLIPAPK